MNHFSTYQKIDDEKEVNSLDFISFDSIKAYINNNKINKADYINCLLQGLLKENQLPVLNLK